ncbi:heparan sulfate glucosamine 3-O-sulfotransferase 5-like [Mytilus californianus]|uniref:heparan sulfate glucosamine 3-O-sulfotransferase 5-like n=1 Tax=Mytilus californianus TaxID=6549 RepID=UPI002245E261|nr:heparan sulfate glucosamine 3-O-sulfotransferase 5-like [Mytilus californianus]
MRKGGTRCPLQFLALHPNIQVSSKEVHYFDRDFFQGISCDKSPERIFRMNSTIKLILLVPDPIKRAMSDHLQLMDKRSRTNLDTSSFEEKVLKDNGDVNDKQIMCVDGKNLTEKPFENETTGHKCVDRTKGRKHPEVHEEVVVKLTEYFEPYNKIFFNQIGQTFDW